jgi:hypothetical protein
VTEEMKKRNNNRTKKWINQPARKGETVSE